MKNKIFQAIAILITSASIAIAQPATVEVADIMVPTAIEKEGSKLVLNGGGVREKYWIDLYVGCLYLESKSSDDKAIIAADAPMIIRLKIVSGLIDSEDMEEAVEIGFKNSTGGKQESMRKEIDQFKKVFSTEIQDGDTYEICYLPNQGIIVYKNGKKSDPIGGLAFKQALFRIWLGENPASPSLKEGMLGK